MSHSTATHTAAGLARHLEALIAAGEYRPGERLPPLRELAGKYGTTAYLVHNSLRQLQQKGILDLRQGSGAYVAVRPPEPTEGVPVTVFASSHQLGEGYLTYALLGIQQCAMRAGWPVTLRKRDYYEYYAPEPPLASLLGDAKGLLFLGEYDYGQLAVPAGIPAVGIEMMDDCDGALSPVTLDPVLAAKLATGYFRRRGKRKIRVFYLDKAPAFRFRAECFRLFFEPYGEVVLEPHPLTPAGIVVGPDDRDVGLLFCGGSYCERCIVRYRETTGRELTADFAVLAIDGKSLLLPSYTPVSTIAINWQAAGEAAFSELRRRLEQPDSEARRIYLLPKLHELEKVARFQPV